MQFCFKFSTQWVHVCITKSKCVFKYCLALQNTFRNMFFLLYRPLINFHTASLRLRSPPPRLISEMLLAKSGSGMVGGGGWMMDSWLRNIYAVITAVCTHYCCSRPGCIWNIMRVGYRHTGNKIINFCINCFNLRLKGRSCSTSLKFRNRSLLVLSSSVIFIWWLNINI